MNFFKSKTPSFHVSSALSYFDQLKKETVFSEELPNDIKEVVNRIGWDDFIKEYPSGLYWEGSYLIDLFKEKWIENDSDMQIRKYNFHSEMNYIGLILKKYYIWDYISHYLFLKSSLPQEILLETDNDLACSIFLAKEARYFKQAYQMLRNFLELSVSILYFHFDRKSYKNWINNYKKYSIPGYRNMIDYLKSSDVSIINEQESNFLHELYTKLNSSVHSKRHQINMNFKRLQRYLDSIGIDDLRNWIIEFDKIVSLMIKLYINKIFINE